MELRRKLLRILGLALIAAALGLIGYSAYNLLSAEIDTQQSLDETEKWLKELEAQMDDPSFSPDPGETGGLTIYVPEGTDDPSGDLLDPADDFMLNELEPEVNEDVAQTSSPDSGTKRPARTKDPNATPGPSPTPRKSSAFGILVFDSLGGRKVAVLEGATARQLARGAAHDTHSSKAGAVGNCVIYGHRNTVFRGFGNLKAGATIQLKVPGAAYTYKVTSTAVVEPGDKRIYKAYSEPAITLVTCYPFNYVGSAPKRYIVVATLQS